MKDSSFRTLLCINVALNVAAIVAVAFPTYSDSLSRAVESEPQPWLMSNMWLAGGATALLLSAWILGLVGLFFYKRWARTLALYTTGLTLLATPLLGTSVSSGIENALFEAASITWGAVLAASYFSSVGTRFGR
jgi:urea transporter